MFLAALLVSALPALDARADDSPEVVHAREEFNEGVSLMAANDWAGALKKFRDVSHVKMNANVAFNMAECEDHLGLLVESLGDYRLAASKAQDGSAPRVAQTVDDRISAMEKRIPHLTITRDEPKPNPAASIQLDGNDVEPAELGKPKAVNPGKRVVAVVINGRSVKTENVDIAEGAAQDVNVTIPEPSDNDVGPGGEPVKTGTGPSIPGIILATLGGASLITGGVMIGLRQKAISDLNGMCTMDTHICPSTAQSAYNNGRTFTGVAEVTIPVGVVALATGVALIVVQGKKAHKDETQPAPTSLDWSPSAPNADLFGGSFIARF